MSAGAVTLSLADTAARAGAILDEVERAVVGKRAVLELVLAGLLADGHILLDDFPGVAKTLTVRSLATVTGLAFSRIQFTPDLLPSDITGAVVLDPATGRFEFRQGPVFANLVLADEVNRAPAKTQSALLESMQERQVSADGTSHHLPRPFLVVATQNPIEFEGTYPLPEAQLDRFLFKQTVPYPTVEEERRIVASHGARTGQPDPEALGVAVVATPDRLAEAAAAVASVRLTDEIVAYVVALVRATRENADFEAGASPRAAAMLAAAGRARACLQGRDYVIPDDIKALALPALRHRVILSPAAEIEGRKVDQAVAALIEQVEAPR